MLASNSKFKKGIFLDSNKKENSFTQREYTYPKLVPEGDLDYEDKRILIIGGDPGTGKSSLVHTIANHCGFHVETLNPNDETTSDGIIERIEFATQNLTLSSFSNKDKEVKKKPTCLIIDGIDPDNISGGDFIKTLENYMYNIPKKSSRTTNGQFVS